MDVYVLLIALLRQDSSRYGSWKTWKVMEVCDFVFQAWKVMDFNCGTWKYMGNYVYGEKSLRTHSFRE